MTYVSRISRVILVAHGLLNMAQGIYSLVSPEGYSAMTGDLFAGASDMALGSIGGLHPMSAKCVLIVTDISC